MQDEFNQLLKSKLPSVRRQELTNMLRCTICEGLYRFAHTIVDCSHTFCQVCLFNYIKGFKGRNPSVKCPQCHSIIQSNFKKSIIRDVFKQSLVDTLSPQFAQEDKIIVKRVQQLLPQFNLQYLFQQFKNASMDIAGRVRKEQDNKVCSNLVTKIKEKFNLSFEAFCQMVSNENKYKSFINRIKNGPPDPIFFEIKPKSDRDFEYIGIKNQIKSTNLTVGKLKRFIQKKALQKINQTEKVPTEWLNTFEDKLDIKVFLEADGYELQNNEQDIEELLRNIVKEQSIFYTLTKPGSVK